MKIGVFDSGVGGLIILKSIVKRLPQYDYIYLGDTQHVPYGPRSQEDIYRLTRRAADFLFKANCQLIIIACNTSSSRALRKLQREYLPKHYPDRRILGVIIPTIETAASHRRIGLIATKATVDSRAYPKEFRKVNKNIFVKQQAAPKLVELIERGERSSIGPVLKNYLKPVLNQEVSALILACTHYPIIKKQAARIAGHKVRIISQDEIIPRKLADYLRRHKEIDKKLNRGGGRELLVTKKTATIQDLARRWFGRGARLKVVKI